MKTFRKLLGILVAVALLLTTVPTVAPAAEAASVTYLDRVEIKIDVPVNGISLKTEADVSVFSDYLDDYFYFKDTEDEKCADSTINFFIPAGRTDGMSVLGDIAETAVIRNHHGQCPSRRQA